MRVLLVSANTEKINMPVLPLGLACVAEATRSAGHDVKLVDLMDQQDTRIVIEDAVNGFQPEIIGISVRNIDDQCMEKAGFFLYLVKDLVNDCRSRTDAPVVLGGAGYSIFPESALAYLGADMGIQGEGEIAFITLLERFSRKADFSGLPGLYLPNQGIQGKVQFTKDLDMCPLPFPRAHQWTSFSSRNEEIWLPFQTRRGCPLNCSYCSTSTIEGKVMRKHSPARVVDAISRYIEAGFDQFFFVDNTFNLPPSYAKALCDQLVKSGLKTSWRCILYPARVDEELVEKMAGAGCKDVSLGFESGSREILRKMNKKFQLEEVRRISERLRHYGIRRMGFLLLGGPGENKKTVEESLAFADSLDLEAMKITTGIRIYPYTDLARTAIKEGVIAPDDDLLFPKFYMAPGLEKWLRSTVSVWIDERPHWMS
ncbi:MAG: radical SAM protein [Desulfobacterales bacterium]|nr:radical SAM protein [Desulfobacterales bacterium]